MSWPLVKPPWKHVKWLTWYKEGSINTWPVPPTPLWSDSDEPVAKEKGELDTLKEQIESGVFYDLEI